MISPIKEVVGRYRSTSYLKKLIPAKSVVNSFLFFSGDLEFNLCESDRFVCAHTNKYVVYEFWQCAIEDPNRIYQMASIDNFSFREEKMFYLLQETWAQYADPFVRSALFYYLNRCSKSGFISRGAPETFDLDPVALIQFKNFKINNFHIEFQEISDDDIFNLTTHIGDCDYYLIPAGKFNYNLLDAGKNQGLEMTTVNHKTLKAQLEKNIDKKIILVYKFHPELLNLYEENTIAMIDKYGNLTNSQKNCEELVVTNF